MISNKIDLVHTSILSPDNAFWKTDIQTNFVLRETKWKKRFAAHKKIDLKTSLHDFQNLELHTQETSEWTAKYVLHFATSA